jgi:short-subunit dehydrogenase
LNAITTAFRLEALKEEGKEGGAQVQVSSVLPGMVATEFGINTVRRGEEGGKKGGKEGGRRGGRKGGREEERGR